jgi:hypothetical protein
VLNSDFHHSDNPYVSSFFFSLSLSRFDSHSRTSSSEIPFTHSCT